MRIYVKHGIYDLNKIKEDFNTRSAVNKVNSSDAEFAKRLKDYNRPYLNNADGTVSTHKMSYVTDDDNNAYLYPQLQNPMANPVGLPTPKQFRNMLVDYGDDAWDVARRNNNYVQMSVPEAQQFSNNYKDYYPDFNHYFKGGNLFGPGGYTQKVRTNNNQLQVYYVNDNTGEEISEEQYNKIMKPISYTREQVLKQKAEQIQKQTDNTGGGENKITLKKMYKAEPKL